MKILGKATLTNFLASIGSIAIFFCCWGSPLKLTGQTASNHSPKNGPAFETTDQGNRHLQLNTALNPYWVDGNSPKLITPQWIGEPGVDAVIVLAIDDMRNTKTYESYLRPIIDRLKKIDGRGPVSIMTNSIDPKDKLIQTWLKEGLSIDVHTIDHPCPCLQGGDFAKAKSTYDRCVDQLNTIPGNKAVAFRMPCCDSQNTPSPRFYEQIFNTKTSNGNFLTIDSSVFNVFTAIDKELPGDLLKDPNSSDRFKKYIPFPSFINTIENYPYPYVIGNTIWQFPCAVPSDWEAQNLHRPNNPKTVADLKTAIDLTVIKKGVFNLVFHPHGWIRNDQIVEIIDHVDKTYGKRVKFLNFHEAQKRIDQNFLNNHSLRLSDGGDSGIRVLDIDGDGFFDTFDPANGMTRLWKNDRWTEFPHPKSQKAVKGKYQFGVLGGQTVCLVRTSLGAEIMRFERGWKSSSLESVGLQNSKLIERISDGKVAARWIDIDRNGDCELILCSDLPGTSELYSWNESKKSFEQLSCLLPKQTAISDLRDTGFRWADIDENGTLDILTSSEKGAGLFLFENFESGWSKVAFSNEDKLGIPVPLISRVGKNNGAVIKSRHLWVQNEDTNRLPDLVDRISFDQLLSRIQKGKKNIGQPKAKSPKDSMATIKLHTDFEIELVAAEPLIEDPVAFDWAPDGSLWVAEMVDYPLGKDGKPLGRVRHLIDTNQDGTYDKSTLFLDKIPFPTGIKSWRNGVIVAGAPDIFYAEDRNKDGVADFKKILYAGFAKGNQQHRVNGLRWGLDGWLHLANGDSGGTIISRSYLKNTTEKSATKHASSGVELRGRDLKILPDQGSIELTTGQTQFGRNRDDFGFWVGGNNSNPMWQYLVEDRYLGNLGPVKLPSLRHQVSNQPGPAQVYPISTTPERFNDFDRANRFTSACSPIFFRDQTFGDDFYGNAFICEPVHNLVHREIVTRKGYRLESKRAGGEQRSEFLASSDNWFRPVMVRTGPDGALWVADMYRLVIEHPEWIPKQWQERLDLRSGSDKGRIYRIFRKGTQPTVPRLDQLNPNQLSRRLLSSNGTERDRVDQMLTWQKSDLQIGSQIDFLKNEFLNKANSPQVRVQILRFIHRVSPEKSIPLVAAALEDEDARIRAHGIFCTESLGWRFKNSQLKTKILADKDPLVQLQLSLSMAALNSDFSAMELGKLLDMDLEDPFIGPITLASFRSWQPSEIASLLKETETLDAKIVAGIIESLASNRLALEAIIKELVSPVDLDLNSKHKANQVLNPWRVAALSAALKNWKSDKNVGNPTTNQLAKILTLARNLSASEKEPLDVRLNAMELLGHVSEFRDLDQEHLLSLTDIRNDPRIQSGAMSGLLGFSDKRNAKKLLADWRTMSPALRSMLVSQMVSRKSWKPLLLKAFEDQAISPTILSPTQMIAFKSGLSSEMTLRLNRLKSFSTSNDRAKVIQEYAAVFKLTGNFHRGKRMFEKHCSACHKIGNIGTAIGPDLTAITDRSTKAMLIAIFDPSRAVEQKYVRYSVETLDGFSHNGLISEETSSSIQLKTSDQKTINVARDNIESIVASGKSLMPDGLEKEVDAKATADIIAFLQRGAISPKKFADSDPKIVRQSDDGSVVAAAIHADIFGPSIILEPKYKNLGFWSSPSDIAIWKLELKRGGEFQVQLDYALAPPQSGNQLKVSIGDQECEFTVTSTGSWDNYRTVAIGKVTLPKGSTEINCHSVGTIRGAMIDLRTLKLKPIARQ